MRTAVVGHVEWVEFAPVERVPAAGEIVHSDEPWAQPAGGGAVAAVQLARLGGDCVFLTALGDDDTGRRAERELRDLGVRVEVAWRPPPTRRAFVHLDERGERPITVMGERIGPRADDDLPWNELNEAESVYVTAGDAGAIRAARASGVLVATVRTGPALAEAGVELDALVASANDPGERYRRGDIDPEPRAVVRTDGPEGGTLETADGEMRRWPATPLPGPRADTYGAGDSFAAGLTFGLGRGDGIDAALELAARCGAACVTGRGPYEGQLRDAG